MMMLRTRVRTDSLETGDLVRQVFATKRDGQDVEESRTVVIGSIHPDIVLYYGQEHHVTKITALDVERNRPVTWIAVPDQHVTVVR